MALLSYGQGDLHDKGGNSFKHDSHYSQQGKDTRIVQASDLRLGENVEAVFGGRIDSFGSRAKGFQFFVPWGATNNLCNESRELFGGHMGTEALVVDPMGTMIGIFADVWIGSFQTLPATAEVGSFGGKVETIGAREGAAWGIRPAVLVIASLL